MDAAQPSLAASNAAYHSFNDIELLQPPSSPPSTAHGRPPHQLSDFNIDQSAPDLFKMQRQDSGYASNTPSPSPSPSPRTSTSHMRPHQQQLPSRHASLMSTKNGGGGCGSGSGSGSLLRSRVRPPTRRSTASDSSSSQAAAAYFQFPAPDLVELSETTLEPLPPPAPSAPPQTTHYWTSDSTRRLEYAAIDAASRGVKGWLRRNLLPDCFVGKERHVAFDDDTGSVRRYRLELEDDQEQKYASSKAAQSRRKSRFLFWTLRKNPTF